MVITLSGEVLFPSGESTLLPGAMVKLNDVADALTKSSPESKIVVEGHTDSQGKAAFNQELSLARAQSVRDYLVSRGIAADRISAKGMGSTQADRVEREPRRASEQPPRRDRRAAVGTVEPSRGRWAARLKSASG